MLIRAQCPCFFLILFGRAGAYRTVGLFAASLRLALTGPPTAAATIPHAFCVYKFGSPNFLALMPMVL